MVAYRILENGDLQKLYRAILCGVPEKAEDTLTDWLVQEKKGNLTRTGRKGEPGAKEARLMYRILRTEERDGQWYSEAEIRLLTGRHHQIRVQFASRGLPLLGDRKYGLPDAGDRKYGLPAAENRLCLCAIRLAFPHPKTGKNLSFSIDPPFSL